MAEALDDPQLRQPSSISDQKIETEYTWPISLLLNQAYAIALSCVKCKGVPIKGMKIHDGEILCDQCAQNMDNITPNDALQKMIKKFKTKCLTTSSISHSHSNTTTDECAWTGSIKSYNKHSKQCQHIIIECDQCKSYKSKRKLLNKHITDECPESTINCSLSCGSSMLRKELEAHLKNECDEQLVDCTNDECKMQIKRKNFADHIDNECGARMVECDYAKYGCNMVKMKANELNKHMEDYKFEHLVNKFDFITMQLQVENSKLKQEINTMSNKYEKKFEEQNKSILLLQEDNLALKSKVQIIYNSEHK